MHKPESVLDNETHKSLWDFEVQTDHFIPARRSNLAIVNKKLKACQTADFAVPADHRVKIKKKRKERLVLGPYRTTKKRYGSWTWRQYQF